MDILRVKGFIVIVFTVCCLFLFVWYNVGLSKDVEEIVEMLSNDENIVVCCVENKKEDINNGIDELLEKTEELKISMDTVTEELIEYQKERNKIILANRSGRSFKSTNVLESSYVDVDQVDFLIQGTELEGLGCSYVRAEQETGINALFLLALSIQESGWGTSRYARERNNIMGYKAYTNNPNKAKYFDHKEDCIMEVARHLRTNYLTEGADYFKGITIKDINYFYAADENWCVKIEEIMSKLVNMLRNKDS